MAGGKLLKAKNNRRVAGQSEVTRSHALRTLRLMDGFLETSLCDKNTLLTKKQNSSQRKLINNTAV